MSSSDDPRDSDGKSDTRRDPPAKARNAERFERQARALRENLRRRNRQRRGASDSGGDAEGSDTPES